MFNREWGKKHREAGKQENAKEWQAAIDRTDLTTEQKAKIIKELEAEREERKKEPA